ncbi:MAG: class I SAM-dependent methyltransferase [Candidatus Dadabacteria bacterium]|nr:MAG: class I SAM-dependent methyltransferase [Candidatus Dadabacteria bacterium]
MSLATIKDNSLLSEQIFKIWLWDAKFKIERISEYLSPKDKILDIGTGPGSVCLLMNGDGYNVTPIDVIDQTLSPEIAPEIYNGKKLPYNNSSFDTALILTVLHHTSNPEEILLEAKRVADKIIIIEDIYTNPIQRYLTYFVDSIVNMEFSGHPHSNKSDNEWKDVFIELGLKLKAAKYSRFLLFFRQATYYLEK